MATFDMTVDTVPMAEELHIVSAGVLAVEGSVVAMKDAVVSTEEQSAKRIGNNVDNGFFMLMNSNLSQKIASCAVTMSSKLLLMKKYAQDLSRTKSSMTGDYERIFRRYKKLFDTLDKEVQLRVEALDESAYKIGTAFNKNISAMANNDAKLFTLLNELEAIGTKAVSALLKSKALRTLDALDTDIRENERYSKGVADVLISSRSQKRKEHYICAIINRAQSLNSEDSYITSIATPRDESFSINKPISNTAKNAVEASLEKIDWKATPKSEKESVRHLFEALVDKNIESQRLRSEMLRLFDASDWLSAKAKRGKGAL